MRIVSQRPTHARAITIIHLPPSPAAHHHHYHYHYHHLYLFYCVCLEEPRRLLPRGHVDLSLFCLVVD